MVRARAGRAFSSDQIPPEGISPRPNPLLSRLDPANAGRSSSCNASVPSG